MSSLGLRRVARSVPRPGSRGSRVWNSFSAFCCLKLLPRTMLSAPFPWELVTLVTQISTLEVLGVQVDSHGSTRNAMDNRITAALVVWLGNHEWLHCRRAQWVIMIAVKVQAEFLNRVRPAMRAPLDDAQHHCLQTGVQILRMTPPGLSALSSLERRGVGQDRQALQHSLEQGAFFPRSLMCIPVSLGFARTSLTRRARVGCAWEFRAP